MREELCIVQLSRFRKKKHLAIRWKSIKKSFRRLEVRQFIQSLLIIVIYVLTLVQLPASVLAFDAKPSNFSVHLSWIIPSSKISSYITRFLIYLDGKLHKNISRVESGYQLTIRDLEPNTVYTVGIETQDGNLNKGERKSEQILTKETGN